VASVVDICKLALGHVYNSAEVTSIDPPDGTAEADHCASYYPIARDECLEGHTWSFATVRTYLAQLASNPMEDIWAYAYQLPNQMIRPLAILLPESTDDSQAKPFLQETLPDGSGVIYTNVEDAILKYIYRQEDPTKFTPLFTIGLSFKLGAYLAGPIAKDPKLKAGLEQIAQAKLVYAASFNKAQKVDLYRDFVPSHLAARS
jgi:hypothetical protein